MPLASSLQISRAVPQHDANDLIALFNAAFRDSENTVLVRHADDWRHAGTLRNASEPLYLPADASCAANRIVFAHGYFASALHEIAHWCLAGRARRKRVDYGYWYAPDDRDEEKQAAFETVEAKPQAIEWAFSIVAGFPFRVSADNLSGIAVDRAAFQSRVHAALRRFDTHGFPVRAKRFMNVLAGHYDGAFRLPAHE